MLLFRTLACYGVNSASPLAYCLLELGYFFYIQAPFSELNSVLSAYKNYISQYLDILDT